MRGSIALAMCAVLGMTLLTGCSTSWLPSWPSSAPVAASAPIRWVCDSQVEVFWQYTDATRSTVDARLGGKDQVYHLKTEPGANGQMFSDGVLAFNVKDDQGLVYWVATNDLIGRGCKAP